jgi:hypothetical protein
MFNNQVRLFPKSWLHQFIIMINKKHFSKKILIYSIGTQFIFGAEVVTTISDVLELGRSMAS